MNWKSNTETYIAAAKSLQSCPTLCDPIDGSPPDSPVPGILQARTLEWVAISFSNAWKWRVKVKSLSRVRLLATPWTVARQAPPSMGFSRQEYWSGVPLPSPETYITIRKIDNWWELAVWSRELKQGALWQPRGMGWDGRWEGDSRRRLHMYTYGWFVLMYGRNNRIL